MSDSFHLLEEPLLEFGSAQTADDPHDGLALFGPPEIASGLPDHVAIGTPEGLDLWNLWVEELNSSAACDDVVRHRPWPPFPGYEVAFGCSWPSPIKTYSLDPKSLEDAASKADRHERVYTVANLFLEPIQAQVTRLDARPALAVCVVPDHVYTNCRPKSFVSMPSDDPKTKAERKSIGAALEDRRSGQSSFDFVEAPPHLEQYGLSPDFRRQIKARVMEYDIPVQIVRESTLAVTEQVRDGKKGVNPLSDRLWNMGTALYYKCGRKPWKTPWAR